MTTPETYFISGKEYPITCEDDLQMACVEWARKEYPHYRKLLHHSPNGGNRNGREGAKFKAMGVVPGWPDLQLAVARGGYHSLFIEMKFGNGSLSQDQIDMIELLRSEGHKVVVHRSKAGFMDEVTEYLT